MISAFKCRAYAAECRNIAERTGAPGQDVLTMAELWDSLARDNEVMVKRFKDQLATHVPSGSLQATSRSLLWLVN